MGYGKHAQSNIGVSLLRDGREIEMQTIWTTSYDPVERWWGAEIEVPSILDTAFGISSDKSSAFSLVEFASISDEALAVRGGYDSPAAMIEEWRRYDDLRLVLLTVKRHLLANIRAIRSTLSSWPAVATRPKPPETIPEVVAAPRTRNNEPEYRQVNSLSARPQPPVLLAEPGRESTYARGSGHLASEVVCQSRFDVADLDFDAFFDIQTDAHKPVILLNSRHPAFAYLRVLLHGQAHFHAVASEHVGEPIARAPNGLRLLLEAWTHIETTARSGEHGAMLRMLRLDWGRVATEMHGLGDLLVNAAGPGGPVGQPRPSVVVRRGPRIPSGPAGQGPAVPPAPERIRRVEEALPSEVKSAYSATAAPPTKVILSGAYYDFQLEHMDSQAPFGIKQAGAKVSIVLNTAHLAFQLLVVPTLSPPGLGQWSNSFVRPGIRELLLAWSQMELAATGTVRRDRIRRAREDLGDALADLIRQIDGAL